MAALGCAGPRGRPRSRPRHPPAPEPTGAGLADLGLSTLLHGDYWTPNLAPEPHRVVAILVGAGGPTQRGHRAARLTAVNPITPRHPLDEHLVVFPYGTASETDWQLSVAGWSSLGIWAAALLAAALAEAPWWGKSRAHPSVSPPGLPDPSM